MNSAYRKAHPEDCRRWGIESYHRCKSDPLNIPKYLLKNAKGRAKSKGLEFSLKLEDIILPEYCPIMKVKFIPFSRRFGYSLDRKNNSLGYTKDNVWVISTIANYMKWDTNHDERVAFATWVLSSEGGLAAC